MTRLVQLVCAGSALSSCTLPPVRAAGAAVTDAAGVPPPEGELLPSSPEEIQTKVQNKKNQFLNSNNSTLKTNNDDEVLPLE